MGNQELSQSTRYHLISDHVFVLHVWFLSICYLLESVRLLPKQRSEYFFVYMRHFSTTVLYFLDLL